MTSIIATLPAAPATLTAPVVHAPAAAPVTRTIECVGRAYANYLIQLIAPSSLSIVTDTTLNATALASPGTGLSTSTSTSSLNEAMKDDKYEQLKNTKIPLNDYYGLLGLDAKWDATEDEIKKAYRIVSILCHPDKATPENREWAEDRFKSLQKGFETLTNKDNRRAYDSTLEFDDAIPGERAGSTEKDFFRIYGPVFERNSRFSMTKPVPKLGDMSTSNDDVNEFYDFWLSFKSWREFSHLGEHRPEQASSREEKRWMMRENEKKTGGKKKEESSRVRKLVEDAMRKDPRMARMKREAEEEKLRKKQEIKDRAKAQIDAAAKAKADEEARVAAEAAAAKAAAVEAKAAKEILKKQQKNFAKACRTIEIEDDIIEKLRAKLDMVQLGEAVNIITADAEKGKAHIAAELIRVDDAEGAAKRQADEEKAHAKYLEKKKEEEAELSASREWNHKEEAILTKAIQKFPGGVVKRWERITEMVNTVGYRTLKEVLRKVKLMEAGVQTVEKEVAFQQYLERMKKSDSAVSASDILLNVPGLTEAEAEEMHKTAQAAEAKRIQDIRVQEQEAIRVAEAERKAAEEAEEDGTDDADDKEEWNSDEQSAFEKALKTVNKDAADRWEQIAVLVKKTKKQCIARFKHIRDEILKKKAAAPTPAK